MICGLDFMIFDIFEIKNNAHLSNRVWTPKTEFLSRGYLKLSENLEITWRFSKIVFGKKFLYMQCKLSCCGQEFFGYGDSFIQKNATIQAFAEAVERFVFSSSKQLFKELFDIKVTSTNGFAAGRTVDEAIYRAYGELVERAVLLKSWQIPNTWVAIQEKNYLLKIAKIVFWFQGWHLQVFSAESLDQDRVFVAFASHKIYGIVFDSVFCDVKKANASLKKLLTSLFKGIFRNQKQNIPKDWHFPVKGEPLDHWKFYRLPENIKAFGFIEASKEKKDFIELPRKDESRAFIIDIHKELPFVAYCCNANWPHLSWGRCSMSIDQKWPHPLS